MYLRIKVPPEFHSFVQIYRASVKFQRSAALSPSGEGYGNHIVPLCTLRQRQQEFQRLHIPLCAQERNCPVQISVGGKKSCRLFIIEC